MKRQALARNRELNKIKLKYKKKHTTTRKCSHHVIPCIHVGIQWIYIINYSANWGFIAYNNIVCYPTPLPSRRCRHVVFKRISCPQCAHHILSIVFIFPFFSSSLGLLLLLLRWRPIWMKDLKSSFTLFACIKEILSFLMHNVLQLIALLRYWCRERVSCSISVCSVLINALKIQLFFVAVFLYCCCDVVGVVFFVVPDQIVGVFCLFFICFVYM